MDININDAVKVKLTQHGIDILKRQHDSLNNLCNGILGEFKLELDKDGYYEDRLWCVMNSFGEYLVLGAPASDIPFETIIKIERRGQ